MAILKRLSLERWPVGWGCSSCGIGERIDRDGSMAERRRRQSGYVLLEELNTRPRTSYAALIRNPNPAIKTGQS
jgi:hypothetical protein